MVRQATGLLISLALFSCHAAPQPANARPPQGDAELRYWLENMTFHRFEPEEIHKATGLTIEQIKTAKARLNINPKSLSPRPRDRLLVLPYPGGRHPRIGFLEGAVRPQRETKISVFAPWNDTSYVVADVPEAIWSNLGLTYLAHTHVETIWTKRGIELEQLEWRRGEQGTLSMQRKLPNGIEFGTNVQSRREGVQMQMWLINGTDQRLTDLRVQNCVLLKGAPELVPRRKMFRREPYAAVGDATGTRWMITAWVPCRGIWSNPKCPCLHSDPRFLDCDPGQTQRLTGWLSFFEGKDIAEEIRRIDQSGWRTPAPMKDGPYLPRSEE